MTNRLTRMVGQRNDALLWKIMGDIRTGATVQNTISHAVPATDETAIQQQKAFGISLSGERTDATLRAVELSCPKIEWVLGHSLNEGTLRQIINGGYSIVLISSLPTNPLVVVESFSKRLRKAGFSGWIVVGNYRMKSFESSIRKRLKDAGVDYASHRLHAICRIINYANKVTFESSSSPIELRQGLTASQTFNSSSLRVESRMSVKAPLAT